MKVSSIYKIGRVRKLVLFGGGKLMANIAEAALKMGLETHVFAVTRHLEEIVDEKAKLTLKEVLVKEKISFYHVSDINKSAELRAIVSADTLGLGLGETYVFNRETIGLFKGKLFDFMVVRLPQYRGGAHFTWQIMREDRMGCWNIQIINEAMVPGVYDSGEVIKTRSYKIASAAKTPSDYFALCEHEGLKLFIDFISEIKADKGFKSRKLDESLSLYLPRLHTLKHAFINWAWDLAEIERFVCAFDDPYAGASTYLNGQRAFLKDCRAEKTDGKFHPFISGLVYRIFADSAYIAVKDGTLVVRKVLDEQGNDLLKSLKTGQRFYTPAKQLEEAIFFNAEYDSEGLTRT